MKAYRGLLGAAGVAAAVSLVLLIWSGAGETPAGPRLTPLVKPARVKPIGQSAVDVAAAVLETDKSSILFLSHRSGQNVLYKMGPDGSDLKPIFGGELGEMPGLPKGTTWYREPHWSRQSPDGKYFISYAFDHGIPVRSFLVPPRFILHLGRMEGGPTRLITPDSGELFTWAPDSRRFAYGRSLWGHPATLTHPVEPATELVVAPIDGRGENVVLDRPGVWEPLDWSPDGGRLLVSYMSTPILQRASSALFELDPVAEAGVSGDRSQPRRTAERDLGKAPEGGGLRVILPVSRLLGCSSARYSPDGEAIALIGSTLRLESEGMIDPSRFASSFELRLLDRSGGTSRVLFRAPDLFASPICWSPDGRRILFTRWNSPDHAIAPDREPAGDQTTIWSIGRDGDGLRALTGGWCPDWRSQAVRVPDPASSRQSSASRVEAPVPADGPGQAATNLKMFAVGLAEFQRARATQTGHRRSRLPVDQQASWIVGMLPQLSRGDLQDRIHSAITDGDDRPWNDVANRKAVDSVLDVLVTPDMTSSGTLRDESGAGLTGFVGVSGAGPASPGLPEGSKDPARGYFGYDRMARPAEVVDGLASTAMVMEVRSRRGPWAQNGPSTVRPIESFEGGLVLMADGTVRSLTRSTDRGLLRALSTIAAGD